MQCPSCAFYNMPGMAVCGRCGASLQLNAVAIDVHPPRASAHAKLLRRWFPLRTWYYRLATLLESVHVRRLPRLGVSQSTAGVLVRMAAPGWAQAYLGQRVRGFAFFGAFVGCTLLGLGLFGSLVGNLFLGLAAGVHLGAMIDVIWGGSNDLRVRLNYLAVAAVCTAVFLYGPVVALAGRYAVPVRLRLGVAPFQAGDIVVYNPSAYAHSAPVSGDVVLYDIPATRIPGNRNGHAAAYLVQGPRIDRILAGPGQKVAFRGSGLLVDGRSSPWLPLNPQQMPASGELTVAFNSYLIVPSTDPIAPQWVSTDGMLRVGVVPAQAIRGRAQLLHRPLGHWSVLR